MGLAREAGAGLIWVDFNFVMTQDAPIRWALNTWAAQANRGHPFVIAVKLLEVRGPGRGPYKYLKWFVQVWFLSWIKNTKKRCKLNSNLLQRGKNDGPKFEPNLSWKERVFCSFLKIDIPLNTESAKNYSKEIPYIYLFRITAYGQMKVS